MDENQLAVYYPESYGNEKTQEENAIYIEEE